MSSTAVNTDSLPLTYDDITVGERYVVVATEQELDNIGIFPDNSRGVHSGATVVVHDKNCRLDDGEEVKVAGVGVVVDRIVVDTYWVRPHHLARRPTGGEGGNGGAQSASPDPLLDYKKKVAAHAIRLKEEVGSSWCSEYDDVLRDLGITEIVNQLENGEPAEPAPGSIARHRSQTIVYVRPWGASRSSGRNWQRNGTAAWYSWSGIKNDVVVLLDTEGAESYSEIEDDEDDE